MEASLQPIKFTIAGFPNLMNKFMEASNYISQIIDLYKKSESLTYNVSSINTPGCSQSQSGRGGNGHGRGGRGCGGRQGRFFDGGRGGRNGSCNQPNISTILTSGKKLSIIDKRIAEIFAPPQWQLKQEL